MWMAVKYEVYVPSDNQIHQGDIFKYLKYFESYKEDKGKFQLSMLEIPKSIVLSQECDLDNYAKEKKVLTKDKDGKLWEHDKFMVSLLCAPLYNAEHLFTGLHLQEIDIKAEPKNTDQRKYIKQNRDPRYHYIEFSDGVEIVPSVIDFKHYFSTTLVDIEDNIGNRLCSICPLYRELITQRFSNFLSRIGLP